MIFFRADGNDRIGAGHIMRCLSIAEAIRLYDDNIVFYTAGKDFSSIIKNQGIESISFNSDYMRMESELVRFKKEICKYQPRLIIIDSYYVTDYYLKELYEYCHKYGGKLVYIDDILSFAYACDYLINYSIVATYKELDYLELYRGAHALENLYPKLLLGPRYMPLRKEFVTQKNRIIRDNAKDIFVSTGGADSEHIALKLVNEILKEPRDLYTYHIVVGAMNNDRKRIERIAQKSGNIKIYYNVNNMAEIMENCDVAISAAGGTLYELCATQTPTVTFIIANNQIIGARYLEKQGIMKCAGDIRELGKEKLVKKLIKEAQLLCTDKSLRNEIISKQKQIIDGHGNDRLVKELLMED